MKLKYSLGEFENETWPRFKIRTSREIDHELKLAKLEYWDIMVLKKKWRMAGRIINDNAEVCARRMTLWEPEGRRWRPGRFWRWRDWIQGFWQNKGENWEEVRADMWRENEAEFVHWFGADP